MLRLLRYLKRFFWHDWGPWHRDGVKYIEGICYRLVWRKCKRCGEIDWQYYDRVNPKEVR